MISKKKNHIINQLIFLYYPIKWTDFCWNSSQRQFLFLIKKIICKQKIFIEASQKHQSFLLNLVKRLHFEVKSNGIFLIKFNSNCYFKYEKSCCIKVRHYIATKDTNIPHLSININDTKYGYVCYIGNAFIQKTVCFK